MAMRFPRISRIRRDKPAREADLIATLERDDRLTCPQALAAPEGVC